MATVMIVFVIFLIAVICVSPNPAATRKEVRKDHCNKTVDIYEDVVSPEVTQDTFGKPMTCWYRFRSFRGTPKDWILKIRFKKFKVGTLVNATDCHNGYLQIVDGNAKTELSNRKDPGLFCGETEQAQTFISETSFVKLLFHVDNFTDQTYFSFDSRAEQQFDVYLRYGQHPELYPNRRGQVVAGSYCERVFKDCRLQTCYVQSPAYPGVYPRNLHCSYHLNTRLPFIKLYIENEEFNIDGQRCENIMTCPMRPISSGAEHCPYDYIKIYDGKDSSSPVIGIFCGMGKFPYSIIGTSEDLFVEFVTSPAGPLLNTGFHFNVGNWPGHVETAGSRTGACDWLLTSDDLVASGDSEGIFLSVAHWYPPHTSCTYLIQGKPNQIVRLYFPSFRINRIESPITVFDGDCGESLTLYDASWPDDARIIKTFCDTFSRPMEKHDFVSTGDALFVRFESKTGSYSGSSLYYWAHYDFFNNTRYGRPVQDTVCDEEIASWTKSSGYLRSPVNTLVYKRTEADGDLHCRYKFITDNRLFARVILTIKSINFKDHPFNSAPPEECWDGRMDKLVIWEPALVNISYHPPSIATIPSSGKAGAHCLCRTTPSKGGRPVTIVTSSTETLNLELMVDVGHSASSYFKHPSPLFEATYEFIHGPLCGPANIPASTEGELHYPHYEALGFTEPPRSLKCLWEIKVNRERDVWLHFDKVRFATRDCQDGRIEVYLPSRPEIPYMTICGHNVSAKEMQPLTSLDLTPHTASGYSSQPSVKIQFIGTVTPARAGFKIAWTELFHLPRNADGTLMTSKMIDDGMTGSLQSDDCGFVCPGENGLCIPSSLVCNGVMNCPGVVNGSLAADEALELCAARIDQSQANWFVIAIGATGGGLLAIACIVLLCKCCCCCCGKNDDDDY
ncbi:cubilin-like [Macrosteles quadrilineatus]|uniref:cubilin-like n=1 Tax=Macrosteles quadrilineatus TaxID=74068 RepID=UPI0023E33C07|nr:cubilin-like [Macrosteles quadrilineatus]